MKQIFYIIEKMDFGHSFLKGVGRIVCILCFALAWGIGAASAQEYLVDFTTGKGVDLVKHTQTLNKKTNGDNVYYEESSVWNHLTENKVMIIELPCVGAAQNISFNVYTRNTVVLQTGRWYIKEFTNFEDAKSFKYNNTTVPMSELLSRDAWAEGKTPFSLDLLPTTKAIRIDVVLNTDDTKISNLKITKRYSTLTYGKKSDSTGDGTISVTKNSDAVSSGSQVYACDVLQFTATPDDCNIFDGWYKGETKLSGNVNYTYPTSITTDLDIRAKFIRKPDTKIACKDFTVLSADGQVSVDLPTIKQGEVDTWSADHGMSIAGNKLNGTLPFGDNEITVTATFCERTDQCVSHIVVVKKLPACESK